MNNTTLDDLAAQARAGNRPAAWLLRLVAEGEGSSSADVETSAPEVCSGATSGRHRQERSGARKKNAGDPLL